MRHRIGANASRRDPGEMASQDYRQNQYPKSLDNHPFFSPDENIPLNTASDCNQFSQIRTSQYSRFDPRGWRTCTKIIAVATVVVIIIAVVVGAYEGWKANRYPNYYPLNYSLKDTYEGETFFDNFWYWSGADPTGGFVVYVLFTC